VVEFKLDFQGQVVFGLRMKHKYFIFSTDVYLKSGGKGFLHLTRMAQHCLLLEKAMLVSG
jgi:hypothetical protein